MSMDKLVEIARDKYFSWVADVSKVIGINPKDAGWIVQDVSWFYCYDDGMTPEEAVAEAREKGIIK